MSVNEDVAVWRSLAWGDMHEVEAGAGSLQVEGEGPVHAGIAIAADHTERAIEFDEEIEHRGLADIAEVPEFVHAAEAIEDAGGGRGCGCLR